MGVALVVTLGGCSQVDALAPVGGAGIADMRYATNEVLLEKNIDILVAPVCSGEGLELRCTGETVNSESITATSTSQDESTFKLVVGTETVYSGDVQTVLDRNGTIGAP
ncbi:hypothetical protein [Rhodococcus sp. IEGM 1379]|uniref:hypothetical protein n=1 Tax=Rhodococcus sp. IEGM 1379 TaxID=3047086 RepID=UPI0024B6B52D|nr:hypothetical protein [Rhodococcus sp. IEGM 1379]MDI9915662.1 hypothetical protein [Rhodococcus sp. IEGM 1379]